MAKEWILNSAMNRWGLNKKTQVGAVSEAIRECAPKTYEQWRSFYFTNIRSEAHLEELGRKLYIKITEVMVAEISEITEEDCIDYIKNVMMRRTFDGYQSEIQTI